ncbi:MAG: lipid-A-disaccharide synthase [Mariprofundaceae bacterium]|nr:lipid-A-disaccharide synthase [Mariprofundaceae bacterium]
MSLDCLNNQEPLIDHHVLICAGETSGDLHAAAVIHALRVKSPTMHISAVAGPAMRAEGCDEIARMESLNVMGIGDVLRALPRIRRIARDLLDWAKKHQPDLIILVDFPGFHTRIGAHFCTLGIPVLYYIAPKLWAWGSWRIAKLRQAQTRLASILPFEHDWFGKHGIDASYVGNPSAYACWQQGWSQTILRTKAGLNKDGPVLAILAGSRNGELSRHASLLAEISREMRQRIPNLQIVTCRAPGITDGQLSPLIAEGVKVVDRLQAGYAMRADAAVAVSGTATLELALWNVPTVLVYRNTPITVWLARKLVGTQCVGLANILLGDQPIMPECIQEYATPNHVLALLEPLLRKNSKEAIKQRQAFVQLQQKLGHQNPAIGLSRIAHEMLEVNEQNA